MSTVTQTDPPLLADRRAPAATSSPALTTSDWDEPRPAVIGFRPVTAADGPGIEAMFARCSPASRYARFLAPFRALPDGDLERVLRPGPGGGAWVAVPVDDPETVVALGDWAQVGDDAELGLIVEDGWQRRGIGTDLLTVIARQARLAGASGLTGSVLTESTHVYRLAQAVLGTLATVSEGYVTRVTTTR
jgi:GNAT superfamily N-acetyltransferase